MTRFAFVTVLAITLSASSASADCGKTYKSFWEGLHHKRIATLSAEQLAAISRMALDAYDACQAGNERQARALFARIALRDGRRDQSTGPYNPNLPE
jgi:hypothetical protein